MRRLLCCAVACLLCASLQAQAADPLALVPQPQESGQGAPIGLRLEAWRQQFDLRAAAGPDFTNRAVLDFRREWSAGESWRFGLSDRFEVQRTAGDEEKRNALRELYASRRFGAAAQGFIDAGRINWRNGVAYGYNPTDYLKRGAVIEQGTFSPQALRENRLGTVMLRGQRVQTAGSLQLALIPDLARGGATAADSLAPAWDRTNSANAGLLKLAPKVDDRTSIDVLVYTRSGERPQIGVNLTRLASDALLLYAEWSAGKSTRLPGPGETTQRATWHNATAAGAAWTSPDGIVATLEYQYSGGALTRTRWSAWQQAIGTPREAELGRLRNERAPLQEPLVSRAWFARLAWSDAFTRRDLDLAAFIRINAFDHSAIWQADATWHVDARNSLRLIVGGFRGDGRSEYGSTTLRGYGSVNWLLFL